MSFEKFDILVADSDQQMGYDVRPMLINLEHIVTIKPINILIDSSLIKGHWIRTSNGKKYRATKIPSRLEQMLNETSLNTRSSSEQELKQPFQ